MKGFLHGCAVSLTILVAACGGGSGGSSNQQPSTPPAIAVSVSPATAQVPIGQTQQFTATVQNSSNQSVTWQVNDVTGGNATVGTISAAGLYSPPATVPNPANVTIRAITQADTTKSATATATVLPRFGKRTLSGQYSFLVSGWDGTDVFRSGGVFTADGNGNLSGVQDLTRAGVSTLNVAFTGTFSINERGEGTATLTSGAGTTTVAFVSVNSDEAYFTEYDGFAVSNGSIEKQDPAAFTNSAMSGNYVFSMGGFVDASGPTEAIGRFTANGTGVISGGLEDVNEGGLFTPNVDFSGTYSVGSNGRGTASLTNEFGVSTSFVFYVNNGNVIRLLSTNSDQHFLGRARRQASQTFSNDSLSGGYSFTSTGVTVAGFISTVGRFSANTGALTGTLDENEETFLPEDNAALTGAYTLGSNGRGTGTVTVPWGASTISFWMIDSNSGYFLYQDSDRVVSGVLNKQVGAPFSAGSVQGTWALAFGGFDVNAGIDFETVGIVTVDNNCQITVSERIAFLGSVTAQDTVGSCSISPEGRGTAGVTGISPNLRFYLESNSKTFIMQNDQDVFGFGVLKKQF